MKIKTVMDDIAKAILSHIISKFSSVFWGFCFSVSSLVNPSLVQKLKNLINLEKTIPSQIYLAQGHHR